MRIYETGGAFNSGFEIENAVVSRRSVFRILESIPGLSIRRTLRRSFFDGDYFCEFELGGTTFRVSEPYRDNSRFWIGATSQWENDPRTIVELPAQLSLLKEAFRRHGPPRWVEGMRKISWVLLASGALACVASFVAGPRLMLAGIAGFVLGGAFLLGAIVLASYIVVPREPDAVEAFFGPGERLARDWSGTLLLAIILCATYYSALINLRTWIFAGGVSVLIVGLAMLAAFLPVMVCGLLGWRTARRATWSATRRWVHVGTIAMLGPLLGWSVAAVLYGKTS